MGRSVREYEGASWLSADVLLILGGTYRAAMSVMAMSYTITDTMIRQRRIGAATHSFRWYRLPGSNG